MRLTGLFAAKVTRIGPKNERTGIVKLPIDQGQINTLGLVNDIQIDKRYHGGPERALHQYSLSGYEKIIKAYPLLHKQALAGSMGENLSITGMSEGNVCIGDIYKIGECKIQVSGPRMPCFKISEKFNTPGLDKFVAKHGIHGWYYRVLSEGKLQINTQIERLERPNHEITVKHFLDIVQRRITQQDQIQRAALASGLDPEWREKLNQM